MLPPTPVRGSMAAALQYVGVNVALIWNVITNDLPALAQQIEQAYVSLDAQPTTTPDE